MHVYDRFRFLVGCFSIYLLAFICTKRECSLCIQLLKPKLCQMSPPYLPISDISMPFQVNLHVPTLIFKIIFRFVCPYRSWSGRGWPIFSILGVLFSRWVFIHLSLHERVAGNRDAQSHNEIKNNNNKIPWKVLVWRAPVDTASHGLWKNGGKEINFTFCLGTTYDVSSMEDNGNSRSFSLMGKACLSIFFISSI